MRHISLLLCILLRRDAEKSPLVDEKKQNETHFVVVAVLTRTEQNNKSERKLKRIAASLAFESDWTIIEGKLSTTELTLSLIVEYGENTQRKLSGVIQGTVIFGKTAALVAQIRYKDSALSLAAIANIKLGQLLDSMDTTSNEQPVLTQEINDTRELMAGVKADLKGRKLQIFEVQVLAAPNFSITEDRVLKGISFAVKHNHTNEASRSTKLSLAGLLEIKKNTQLKITASSGNDNLSVEWIAQQVPPAKIANGLVSGGLATSNDSKPELPPVRGSLDGIKSKKDRLRPREKYFSENLANSNQQR